MRRLRKITFGVTAVAIAAVGALIIANAGDGNDERATAPTTAPPTTTAPNTSAPRIDWVRTGDVGLGDGWHVVDCEGDAPLVCVEKDGVPVGFIEYISFDVSTLPNVDAAAGDREALLAQGCDYLDAISEDRAQGCEPGHRFVPDKTRVAEAADGLVVRYGFTATLSDGRPSERTIQWAGIRGEDLVLVSAAAYDAGGCLGTEGSEFTTENLNAFAGSFDRLVLANELPPPRA